MANRVRDRRTGEDRRDRRKIKREELPTLRTVALLVNKQIREAGGQLPKPRVEVIELAKHKGFKFRPIDKYGRKGDWSPKFTLRNNTRRAARKAHPGLPVVSR